MCDKRRIGEVAGEELSGFAKVLYNVHMPTDEDFSRGYSVSKNGAITLLRPLSGDTLSDLFNLHPNQMTNLQVQQTKLEIETPVQPAPRSRQSKTANGYIFLVGWSNACLLRILMTAWFRWYRKMYGYNKGFYPGSSLPTPVAYSHASWRHGYGAGRNLNSFTPSWLNPKLLDRLEAQILDSIRSVIANIEEGFARPTTIEYLTFLGYSQASLIEAKGDGQRMGQDGLMPRRSGSALTDLGVDLKDWHITLKKSVISRPAEDKGTYRNLKEFTDPLNSYKSPLNSFNFGYPPVDNFAPSLLTYEMLIELINKTDWHLRKLIVSLEEKLNQDKQYYLIEQTRLRGKINWRK